MKNKAIPKGRRKIPERSIGPQRSELDSMLAEGVRLLQLNQPLRALAVFREGVRRFPKNAHLWDLLGVTHAQTGSMAEAVDMFRRAVRLNRRESQFHFNLGMALSAAGEVEAAESAFREAVKLKPGYGAAHNSLGVVLSAQGRHADAALQFREAVRLMPGDTDTQINLGNALAANRELDDAIAAFRKAREMAPNSYLAALGLANTFLADGDYQQAVEQYSKASELKPGHPDIEVGRARALLKQGRLAEARNCLEKALSDYSDNEDAYYLLGECILLQGRYEDALAHFQSGVEAGLNAARGYHSLGDTYSKLGRFDEAVVQYENALSLDPGRIRALRAIAEYSSANREQMIARLSDLLNAGNLSEKSQREIGFTLGKLNDQAGRYDQAFEYYQRANRLRRGKFDPIAFSHNLTALITSTPGEFFSERSAWGNPSERPVFILGMPRSGTTLVERILGSHPEVYAGGELPFFHRITQHKGALDAFDTRFVQALLNMTDDTTRSLAQEYLAFIGERDQTKSRFTNKLPHNFLYLGLIAITFPRAQLIHCVRNPMDTCLSIFFQEFQGLHSYAYDLSHLGTYYRDYQRVMAHWREVVPCRILDVQYEALVQTPEPVARELVEFCGLNWDERCLEFQRAEGIVETASRWQVRQPIYRGSVDRWKNYEKFLAPLQAALGDSNPKARSGIDPPASTGKTGRR